MSAKYSFFYVSWEISIMRDILLACRFTCDISLIFLHWMAFFCEEEEWRIWYRNFPWRNEDSNFLRILWHVVSGKHWWIFVQNLCSKYPNFFDLFQKFHIKKFEFKRNAQLVSYILRAFPFSYFKEIQHYTFAFLAHIHRTLTNIIISCLNF